MGVVSRRAGDVSPLFLSSLCNQPANAMATRQDKVKRIFTAEGAEDRRVDMTSTLAGSPSAWVARYAVNPF